MRVLPALDETPTKEPIELAVIDNFHHRRPHGGSISVPFDPKLKALTTRPRIHLLWLYFKKSLHG